VTLPPHSRTGAYEVICPLGAGGMGEVYRATDTVLRRQGQQLAHAGDKARHRAFAKSSIAAGTGLADTSATNTNGVFRSCSESTTLNWFEWSSRP
jgi:hypothetical protein